MGQLGGRRRTDTVGRQDAHRGLEPGSDRGDLGWGRCGDCVADRPVQGAAHHPHCRPPSGQIVQPTLGTHHDVVVVQVIGREGSQRGPGLVDEWHPVGDDQPPRQGRQVDTDADEAVAGVVGVDPHRPRCPLHQARHVDEPGFDLGEGGVIPQHQVETPTGGKVTGSELHLDRLAAHGPVAHDVGDDSNQQRILQQPSPDHGRSERNGGSSAPSFRSDAA